MAHLADQWVNIKSKDLEGYSFKFSLGDALSFFISNLRTIFTTTVKKGSLASTCPVKYDDVFLQFINISSITFVVSTYTHAFVIDAIRNFKIYLRNLRNLIYDVFFIIP